MNNIREYAEEMDVEFDVKNDRNIVRAYNEAGHNCTEVDLVDLLEYVKEHMSDVWESVCDE